MYNEINEGDLSQGIEGHYALTLVIEPSIFMGIWLSGWRRCSINAGAGVAICERSRVSTSIYCVNQFVFLFVYLTEYTCCFYIYNLSVSQFKKNN
jgi:hypothetical protein